MISAISSIALNKSLSSIAGNTNARVSLETLMKSIGRPGFILIDNKIDPETKKYAAMKEFLYQATCLVIYAAVVVPVFKKGAFKLGKKYLTKFEPGFTKFKSAGEYMDYFAQTQKPREYRLGRSFEDYKFTKELRNDLRTKENPEQYKLVRGMVEAGAFVGSVLGLAMLAPQVSHYIVHPVLKFLGFEKPEPKPQNKEVTNE